ncbi:LAMI_0C01750g1_1 [Lachancea mirantina]|uniref:RNA helicase n=1 Tax=Lachancea mirantina TaxID=1230905 RepID=A0A1G4J0P8_9SACH|nr:LAMI_0C01750g1_1 [Lachancea mirantina]
MTPQNTVTGTGSRRVRHDLTSKYDNENTLPENPVSLDAKLVEKTTKNDYGVDRITDAKEPTSSQDFDELRLLARHEYLTQREEQKIAVVVKELEYLEADVVKYGWDNLSRQEQDEITLKREVVKLFNDKLKRQGHNGFLMGDGAVEGKALLDKKRELLKTRSGKDRVQVEKSAQKQWEDKQLNNAVQGSDYDTIKVEGSEEYEFVFDEQAFIEFSTEDGDSLSPGSNEEVALTELESRLEKETARLKSIHETRKSLPVYQYRDDLLNAVKEHQIMIVVGETGSGKTTQLPQYLVEDGYTQHGKLQVACTQPRRVAATSVATRVADEMGVMLGKEVGYSIRFEDKTTPGTTFLKYMTDGMLLREFMIDPELTNYACIMIDEAHERTLATDILLGLLKDILPHRKDLKLIISSATMNAVKFSEFFYGAPIFNVPGRRFPVDIHYTLQPEANYINAAITTVFQIHTTQSVPGDILVFLTGQEEIESAQQSIEEIAHVLGDKIRPLIIAPIYANLPQDQQSKIFQRTPEGCRKVVLATNIAETSLTINGINFVIDPGFVKENSYVAASGMSQLLTVPCSRASVDQRAGRAGRVGPGKCFRLFTKWSYFHELEPLPKPEILRVNLSQVVLLLMSMGIRDLVNFPLLDKPSIPTLSKALENLYVLGALNSKGAITRLGHIMCDFPCEPQFGKVMHTAATHEKCKGVLEEAVTIVAMLHETSSVLVNSRQDANKSGIVGQVQSDHMLYLEIFNAWKDMDYSRSWCLDHKVQYKTMLRVRNIRDQLWRCCEKLGLAALNEAALDAGNPLQDVEARLTRSFIAGFPGNIAQLGSSGYRTMGRQTGGLTVNIHPSSVVFQMFRKESKKPTKHLLYQRLVLTSKEYMRDCIPIPRENWLHDMLPHLFAKGSK